MPVRTIQTPTWKDRPFRTASRVLAWTSLALLPLLAIGCNHKEEADETKTLVEVETINPERRDMTRDIEQPGYLRPFEMTPIYTKIAGFCLEWTYDIGDVVKKGTNLVTLYVPEVDQELKVKEARVEQAEADVDQAKEFKNAANEAVAAARANVKAKEAVIDSADAEVMRWKGEEVRAKFLLTKGVYDQGTYDQDYNQWKSSVAKAAEARANLGTAEAKERQAVANFNKAKADVKVAEASHRLAKEAKTQWEKWLSYKYIPAPYDGVITLRNIATGDFLQPANSGSTSKTADPLYVMMRTDIMRCCIDVPEMDAILVKDGEEAEIYFQAMPGAPTIGKVKRNAGALDLHSRTLRVEVHLPNPDGRLKPAMYANVKIKAKVRNAWSLPPSIVMNDILANGDRRYCFMLEDGKDGTKIARKTFLEVGQLCDEGMVVLRKQRAGSKIWQSFTGQEAVVTTNAQALLDGQTVTLKATAAK
jgi:HlyD family secretion protein